MLKNRWIKEISEWILCFIIAYGIYLVINYFIGTIAGVRQQSMYPTANDGDRVIISRRVLFNKKISRGNIVILEAPLELIGSQSPLAAYEEKKGLDYFTFNVMGLGKKSYIKRVIGMPGEHLYISEEGDIYINDKLLDEPYLIENLKTPRTGEYYDVQIPEGYVFVMGDNRKGSKDSRELGLIPLEKIEGKVIVRIWPLNRIGKL